MVSNFLLVQKPNCRLRQDRLVGRQIPRKWLFRVELESASRAGRYFPTEEVARYQSVIATAQLMKSVPNKNRMFVSTARNALFSTSTNPHIPFSDILAPQIIELYLSS